MVGRVISGAFDVYGALFPLLIGVAAALVVPFQAVVLALQLAAPDREQARDGALLIHGLGTVLLILPLVTVVAIRAAEARERKSRVDARGPLQRAWSSCRPSSARSSWWCSPSPRSRPS